jgi:hypothetical protein
VRIPALLPLQSNFLARWHAWYPDVPPVGFLLRQAYVDRWLRVHAMPQAKRNPVSGRDYAELLRRFNTVADDLLGPDSLCTLVVLHECGVAVGQQLHDTGISPDRLTKLGALPEELWDEDAGVFAVPMCLRGATTIWRRGYFDVLFSAVAQDRMSVLLTEHEHGKVFAPYHGGADIIFANRWERDQARERYREWLSLRDDGL